LNVDFTAHGLIKRYGTEKHRKLEMIAHEPMANHNKEQVNNTITQPQYYPFKKKDLGIAS
jgi:hypothetical protein